jgi:iron complex outermembrane receptor protein
MSNSGRRHASQRRRYLAFAASGLAAPLALVPAFVRAATPEVEVTLEEVIVTATRRTESVQDVPINITALSGDAMTDRGITSLAEIMREVPGFFVVNQGGRNNSRIVARGINASPISAPEALPNTSGGTVSTYVGEIPLYVDLNVIDLERVEVLLGPQGTLYGAGTMGGAVRYLPKRPSFAGQELKLDGGLFSLAHSSGLGTNVSAVFNTPLSDTFAARAVLSYTDDPGFVDYDFVLREPGVSDPEPDFSDPADVTANLQRVKDADDQQLFSGRVGLRWRPSEILDANLTYYYQQQDTGGRTISNREGFGTGPYTSGLRYREPNERRNQLLALEVEADLGFASLTSATGLSRYKDQGQRDQSDLLITLGFSYELFPAFSAFTLDEQKDKNFSQELRLVSNLAGPVQWIVGGFYNRSKADISSKEFTPGYADYLGGSRPDALEYYSLTLNDLTEQAAFGEVSWRITDRWQVTAGGRWYKYDLDIDSGYDLPLYNSVFGGAGPDEINLVLDPTGQNDSGSLFKFNTSFDFTDDVLGYMTISEGYRIGSSNPVPACQDPLPPGQNTCGQPEELQFYPDSTLNYELGMRSQWLDRRLTLNAAVYYIDWKDPQLLGSTVNGELPITKNGRGAESSGVELSFNALLTDRLRLWGNYSYAKAELSKLAPALISTYAPGTFTRVTFDGQKGDRLPGSPQHQGSINLRYEMPLANGWQAGLNYGISGISNVITRTGLRGDGERLGGYGVNFASVDVADGPWTVSLYADNLFDKYAETGVRASVAYNQTVENDLGDPVRVRSYYKDVLRPREIGLRFSYDFNP